MKRRRLLLFLGTVMLLLIFALPCGVSADIIDEGSCGENLTWTLDDRGLLTISGSGRMDDWRSPEAAPWHSLRNRIKAIVIEEEATSVGANAFGKCERLRKVTMAKTVIEINGSAFYGCGNLQDVTMAEGLKTIGGSAFRNCRMLIEITIPDTVTQIGRFAFGECINLERIALPSSLTVVSAGMFYNCDSLYDFWIPEQVTAVEDEAFAECANLTRIFIAETVTSFCRDVFKNCPDLTIFGKKGSEAERYAEENGIPFCHCFDDVMNTGAFYFTAVYWAAQNGITVGVSEDLFAPEQNCSRAQAVTFLWRAAGKPEPMSMSNPFTDVGENSYYYKAVLWAVQNNITKGTAATSFSPNQVCSRAQVVTFLYRMAGSPAISVRNPFTDVGENSYYYQAVLWAAESGVTSGTSATTFSPAADCTRGQVATFLYRDLAE